MSGMEETIAAQPGAARDDIQVDEGAPVASRVFFLSVVPILFCPCVSQRVHIMPLHGREHVFCIWCQRPCAARPSIAPCISRCCSRSESVAGVTEQWRKSCRRRGSQCKGGTRNGWRRRQRKRRTPCRGWAEKTQLPTQVFARGSWKSSGSGQVLQLRALPGERVCRQDNNAVGCNYRRAHVHISGAQPRHFWCCMVEPLRLHLLCLWRPNCAGLGRHGTQLCEGRLCTFPAIPS